MQTLPPNFALPYFTWLFKTTGANVWSCIIWLDTSDVSSWNSKLNVGPFVSQSVSVSITTLPVHSLIN